MGPSSPAARARGDRQQRLGAVCRLDVAVGERDPGGGEMHVGVDEPRDDRGAGQVDHAVRFGCLAGPHALDVPAVDEHPLPRRGVALGVDRAGAVEGPHGGRIMSRAVPVAREIEGPSNRARALTGSTTIVLVSFTRRPRCARARRNTSRACIATSGSGRRPPRRRPTGGGSTPPWRRLDRPGGAPRSPRIADASGPTGRPRTPRRSRSEQDGADTAGVDGVEAQPP